MERDPQGIRVEVWEAAWLVVLLIKSYHRLLPSLFESSNPVHIPKSLVQLRLKAYKGLFQAELRELTLDTFSGSYAPAVTSSLLFRFRVTL